MWLLQVTTAARVGTHAYVNPVIAVILGWLVAREPLSLRMLFGTMVIVGSVLLVNGVPRAKTKEVAELRAGEAAAD
jgi:drug/metabolite transporter (DMT)-like permease